MLDIRVQPGARRSEVAGLHAGRLKIRIAAPAIEGRANDALVAFLAEALGVPRQAVRVLKGGHSRDKAVAVGAAALDPQRLWSGA